MKFSYLLKYLTGLTIYQKIPIYNLNWLLKGRFFDKILCGRSITLVDVGARNISVEELIPLQRNINYIGFDADVKEVERLNSNETKFKTAKYIASYVGAKDQIVKFGLHYEAGNSSIFPFDEYYNKWFRSGDKNYVKEIIELRSNSLDELINEDVDIIKLDTQGTEYEILTNAKKCLESALMVEAEVEFVQMYQGQKLAHDIFKLLHTNGFELLYLNRVFAKSCGFMGESRGQITFADALFGVSREKARALPIDKKIKYIALLINYGHIDFAFDIYNMSEELRSKLPALNNYFKNQNRRKRVKIVFSLFIDKIIFILLVLRKTNGLRCDSDRSWPIR
jgi:FkbM family methyltransferase